MKKDFRTELADLIERWGGRGIDLRVDLQDALDILDEEMEKEGDSDD